MLIFRDKNWPVGKLVGLLLIVHNKVVLFINQAERFETLCNQNLAYGSIQSYTATIGCSKSVVFRSPFWMEGAVQSSRQFLHISAYFCILLYICCHLERQWLGKLYSKAYSMSSLWGTEHALSFNFLCGPLQVDSLFPFFSHFMSSIICSICVCLFMLQITWTT